MEQEVNSKTHQQNLQQANTKKYLGKIITNGSIGFELKALEAVKIKRKEKDGKEIQMKINLKDIIKGKKPDIVLKEGDVIYVPESLF